MEDEDFIGTPAFKIGQLPDDYKPGTSPPVDGIEYLRQVQFETRNLPAVVSVSNTFTSAENKNSCSETFLPMPEKKIFFVNDKLLPSIHWQNKQVADFADIRGIIRAGGAVPDLQRASRVPVPNDDCEDSWFKICVDGTDNTKQQKYHKTYQDPTLSFLLSLTQETLSTLLEYFVDWIENGKTTIRCSGRWIYAILACLEIPLLPDTCDSLRKLSRLAAEERSKLNTYDSETVNPLNLFICLVGRYFSQLDLAD